MATDLKMNASFGDILKAGLVEIQQATSLAPQEPAPKAPDMEK